MAELIKRSLMTEIAGYRNKALKCFEEGIELILEGIELSQKASNQKFYFDRELLTTYSLNKDDFINVVRKTIDKNIWMNLIHASEIEKLMDSTAKEEFRKQLEREVVEATEENILATMQTLMGQANEIFIRGIAKVFSSLDKRFKTNDAFKFGDKIILTNCINDFGSWTSYKVADTIRDVEKTFILLDQKIDDTKDNEKDNEKDKLPSIVDLICKQTLQERFGNPTTFIIEDEYFKVKRFKNGNLHIWFKREDLLIKINNLLAEYYGATLGNSSSDQQYHPNTTKTAKNDGWFPTPKIVIDHIRDYFKPMKDNYDALEPSAGEGNLSEFLRENGANVDCIEINADRAKILISKNFVVIGNDFLKMTPTKKYDRILMNPPFDKGLDVIHVRHAINFLKPSGQLIAIMSAGARYRSDKATQEFHKEIEKFNGKFYDLPAGSFKESGTNVNTTILVINRN